MLPDIDWITIKGNFRKENNEIIFFPREKPLKSVQNEEAVVQQLNSDLGELYFPIPFIEGTIYVEFEFEDITFDAMALIVFQKKFLTASQYEIATAGIHNCMGFAKLKRYNQVSWSDIVNVGEEGLLISKKAYKLKLITHGSTITFLVNGITMFSTNAFGPRVVSDVGIICRNQFPVTIKKFEVTSRREKAFVVMQFTEEFNKLYEEVIKPQCEHYGLQVTRADETISTGMIIEDIIKSITESAVVIADITPDNPNVFYEVGYAHALEKFTILLCDKKRTRLPFDLSPFRTLFYENSISGKREIEESLSKFLKIFDERKTTQI